MFGVRNTHSDGARILLNILCYVLIGGWTFLLTIHLLGIFYGCNGKQSTTDGRYDQILLPVVFLLVLFGDRIEPLYKFHRRRLPNNAKELPGISIIKPLTCIDGNLYENLKTFFTMNYPHYEVLFCIQEHDSELIELVEGLRAQYPKVESQVFVGSKKFPGVGDESEKTTIEIKNPKIFNMLAAYEKAQYPFFLISDSGLMMREDTLYDMALCMTDDVGLVHQMPFTCDRKGFAGSVEKVYFGTQHARMYMTINLIGINCVTGMSCLIRKECIDRVGGLKAFGHYIAEDYYIAYEISKQGWKLRVATTPAQQNSGDYSIPIWMDRMIRWCKLRMRLSPLAYIEPLQECLSSAVLAGVVSNYLFEWNILVVAACHILIWFICDYVMLRITQGGPLPFSKFEFAIAWLVRELSSFYIYFKAFTGSSTIKWRGKEYRLGSGTRAEEISLKCSVPSIKPSIVGEVSSTSSSSNSTLPVTSSHLLSPLISSK